MEFLWRGFNLKGLDFSRSEKSKNGFEKTSKQSMIGNSNFHSLGQRSTGTETVVPGRRQTKPVPWALVLGRDRRERELRSRESSWERSRGNHRTPKSRCSPFDCSGCSVRTANSKNSQIWRTAWTANIRYVTYRTAREPRFSKNRELERIKNRTFCRWECNACRIFQLLVMNALIWYENNMSWFCL